MDGAGGGGKEEEAQQASGAAHNQAHQSLGNMAGERVERVSLANSGWKSQFRRVWADLSTISQI